MKWLKKNITTIVAVIGCLTGGRSAYTIWTSEKFQKVLSSRDAVASSFGGQISSADARGAIEEANRIRIEYERFEANWRTSQTLIDIIASAILQPPMDIDLETRVVVADWAGVVRENPDWGLNLDPQEMGNAWFVAGEFDRAIVEYQLAQQQYPTVSSPLFSQARAHFYLAELEEDQARRVMLNNLASEFAIRGLQTGDQDSFPLFLETDKNFAAFLGTLSIHDESNRQ